MPYPYVSVEGTTVADDRAFAPEITVTRQFSADAPALVRIELANEARTNTEIGLARIIPFDATTGHLTDGSASLYLVPESGSVRDDRVARDPPPGGESLIPAEPIDGCWRVMEYPLVRESGTLWNAEPGATLRREHAVLDGPESETCLQPGTYRFAVNWTETPRHDLRGVMGEQQYSRPEDSTSYSWSFTVSLHE